MNRRDWKRRLSGCILAILPASLGSSAPQSPAAIAPAPLVIRAGRMVDVQRGALVEGVVIVVEGGRIRAAGPVAAVTAPPGAKAIDLSKLTVLPGLIDAHVHLAWGSGAPGEALAGVEESRATLAAGFTTVRNPGSTGKADLKLRDAIAAGAVDGPRVAASGPGLGPPGGVCDQVFAGGAVASGVEAVRNKVREVVAAGADFIKFCAGGGVAASQADVEATEYSEEEVRALVEEAHRAGKKVAAHAQGPAAIGRAVRAGVDSIEHGAFIDAESARLMKERGVVLVPTLYRLDWRIEAAAQGGAAPAALAALRRARDQTRENVRRAIALGVPMAFGTDATVYPHGLNAREFAVLVEVGMTPAAALRAATVDAAALLGWSDRVGSIEVGKAADLIAVEGNPLENVATLETVLWVMKDGRVHKSPSRAAGASIRSAPSMEDVR